MTFGQPKRKVPKLPYRARVMAAKKSYPFEQSLEKLEQLVERMEEGDLSLEESLKTFEEGIKLTRQCQQALVKAEQKVKLLIEENGQISEKDFEDLDHSSLDT